MYLARAVGLSAFETIEAIGFATFIAIAGVDASAQGRTIVIDTDVPVLIRFQILNDRVSTVSIHTVSNLALTNSVVAIVTAIQASNFTWAT